MKPDELFRQIEKKDIKPVYFLSGDEEFSKEDALQRLIAVAIDPGTEAFGLDLLNGENADTDATTVLTLASTVPMLSDRRVIVVRAFHKMSQGDREAIIGYAEQPVPTTCLVLITARVDLKTKLYARLNKAAASVIFYPMNPERDLSRIQSWLQQRVRQGKKKITVDACQELVRIVGGDLGELASELEKLTTFVGDKAEIDAADVGAVMGQSRTGTVFDLAQAIGEKDLAQAHRAYSRTMDGGDAPQAIVAILVRHLTILWKIRFLKQEKRADEDVKKTLKLGWIFNQQYPKYLKQAKLLSREDLYSGYESLLQADLALKSSTQSPQLVMHRLLYDLCVEHGDQRSVGGQ